MAKIHYSMSGEGRGHAARAKVIVEMLRKQHEITLYAYGAALEMLRPIYQGTDVRLEAIPGLRFRYNARGTLNRPASLASALPFLSQLPTRARKWARKLEKDQAELLICDFEPLLPRAAELAKIPTIAIDHQQFLTRYDLSSLPSPLLRQARLLQPFVRSYYKALDHSVVSAFFFPPLIGSQEATTQAGVLLREEILNATAHDGNYLVAYLRRNPPASVIRAMQEAPFPMVVYGTDRQGKEGNLEFRSISAERFAADLAGARGLITSAGNQLIGESLYLGKPVLAFPEPGNFEQKINAHFITESGTGWAQDAANFDAALITAFVETIPRLRERIRPARLNGNEVTRFCIERQLRKDTSFATFGAQIRA